MSEFSLDDPDPSPAEYGVDNIRNSVLMGVLYDGLDVAAEKKGMERLFTLANEIVELPQATGEVLNRVYVSATGAELRRWIGEGWYTFRYKDEDGSVYSWHVGDALVQCVSRRDQLSGIDAPCDNRLCGAEVLWERLAGVFAAELAAKEQEGGVLRKVGSSVLTAVCNSRIMKAILPV